MWSGACKPAEAHISMFFFFPLALPEKFLRGGGAKALETLEATPQKFHCSSRILLVSENLQRPGLKSDIRRTHTHLFWKPKKYVGGWIFRAVG